MGALIIVGGITAFLINRASGSSQLAAATGASPYATTSVPLTSLSALGGTSIDSSQQLDVNGQLRINNSAVITASNLPAHPTLGQLYLSKANDELYYYNGTQFVTLGNPSQEVTAVGGLSGAVGLGQGLTVQGGQIANSGVLSVQGQTGAVSLTAGGGIGIRGLTVSNTGVTSLQGTANQIAVSQASGGVTLSLPQDIDSAAAPTFANLSLSSLTPGGVVVSGAGGGLAGLVPSAAGECLLSAPVTLAPEFGSCNSGASIVSLRGLTGALGLVGGSGISVTDNGTNTITVANAGVTSLNTATGDLTIANSSTATGGTITINDASTSQKGIAEFTTGDFAVTNGTISLGANATKQGNVFNGDGDLVQLDTTGGAATSTGECLLSTSSGAGFGTCGNIVSGTSQTAGSLTMFDTATNAITNSIVSQSGTTVTVAGSLGATALSGDGTGVTSVNAAQLQGHVATYFQNASNIDAGTLAVAYGGTGLSSLAAHGLLVGNGTGAVSVLGAGTNGDCLLVESGAPAYDVCPGATAVTDVNGHTGSVTLQGGSGIGFDTSTLTFSNSGVLALTGTSNEVSVSSSTGNVTLSLPQAIATNSAVQFGSLALTTALPVTSGGTGAATAATARSNLSAAASGTNADITSLTDITAIDPTSALAIDPAGTLTAGSTTQQLILQGTASSTLSAYNSTHVTTLGFATPTGTNAITLPNASGTVAVSASGAISLNTAGNITCPDCLTTDGSGGGSGVTDVNAITNSVTIQGGSGITIDTDTGAGTITVNSTAGGVASVNGLTGAININDASTDLSNNITIQDASLAQKGIAEFTTGDFTASSGVISLDASVTKAGNVFNGDGELVQLDSPGGGATATGQCLRSTSTGAAFSACPAGGDISSGTSQTAGNLVMFDTTTNAITDSIASQSSTTISVAGTLAATALSGDGSGVTGVNAAQLQGHAATYFQNASNIDGGTLAVAYGGTGLNSVANNDLLVGNGTGALSVLAPGSDGECLIVASGAPTYGSCSGGAAVVSINGHTGAVVVSAGSGITISDTGSGIEIDSTASALALQDAYNNSGATAPKIKVSSADGPVDIQDADTTTGGSLLEVTASDSSGVGSPILRVDSNGRVSIGDGSLGNSAAVIYLPASDTNDALQIYNGFNSIFRIASDGSISGTNAIFNGTINTSSTASFGATGVTGTLAVDGNIVQNSGFKLGVGTTTPSALLDVEGSQPGLSSVNGINATQAVEINAGTGGDTSGTTGQYGGYGGNVTINGGIGGNADAGSTNGSGGSITLQGGAPGSGSGVAGSYGSITLQASGGDVGIGTSSPLFDLDVAGGGVVNTTTSYDIGGVAICTASGCKTSSTSGIANSTTKQTGNFYIQSAGATDIGAVIQGATSQTADLLDIDSATGLLDSFDASGDLGVAGFINTSSVYQIGGAVVLQTPGTNNAFVGGGGNASLSGSNNVALGNGSLQGVTSGGTNTAVGESALSATTTGAGNTALGYKAGVTGTSGNANVSGSNNTFIGYDSGPGSTTQLQNASAIGSYATVNESDALVLGCLSGTNGCTTSTTVGVDTATPNSSDALDVNGAINSSSGYSIGGTNINVAGTLSDVAYLDQAQTFTAANLIKASDNAAFEVQASGGAPLLTADTTTMTVTVQTLVVNADLTVDGHLITGGGNPAQTVEAAAGSGASCVVAGTDTTGLITVTTGSASVTAGALCTVTFHTAYGATPQVVVGSKAAAAAALEPYSDNTSSTSFDLGAANAPAIGTVYTFEYIAAQ